MTTDRFYGGVTNRLANLHALLAFVSDEQPSRDAVVQWIIDNTRASSADAGRDLLIDLYSDAVDADTTNDTADDDKASLESLRKQALADAGDTDEIATVSTVKTYNRSR